jgi:hypothetical protein
VLLSVRAGRSLGFWGSIGVGLKTGAVAGAIFFVVTAVALWLLSSAGLTPFARQLGAAGPISLNTAVMLGLAFAAVIGLAVAGLSAGATYPLARSKA